MPRLKTAIPPGGSMAQPKPPVEPPVKGRSSSLKKVKMRDEEKDRNRGRGRNSAQPSAEKTTRSPEKILTVMAGGNPSLPQFDAYDTAPEDRVLRDQKCLYKNSFKSVSKHAFKGEPTVSATFNIKGVNYMRYLQLAKVNPRSVGEFQDGIRDDLCSLLGYGVRTQDILMNISPGKVTAMSLIYDKRDQDLDDVNNYKGPRIRDATCDMSVELLIRSRDVVAQQSIAAILFAAIQDRSLSLESTVAKYGKWIDPANRYPNLTLYPPRQEEEPKIVPTPVVGSACTPPSSLYRC
eukprot:TRINITY_DN853_c0_g1_i1.p1 TRINITY_DN853_c0_g1~~TRINITY_DN853_c0_g1_i1.p1  ORF type:complete len:293 (+),score=35.11 TRINITY_DN853_c0_g1_i1:60-938(+)